MMKNMPRAQNSGLWVFGTLSACLLALTAAGAWKHSVPAASGKTITATITPPAKSGGAITVSPDPVPISKSAGDSVKWECPKCPDGWKIHFPKGTPFSSTDFDQSHPNSGAALGKAKLRTYKYGVKINKASADPGVKLNP